VNWDRYKLLCDLPDVLSRWMLLQTVELLQQEPHSAAVAVLLEQTLRGEPLCKPVDHRGGPLTDMFRLSLTATDAAALLDAVTRASAAGRSTTGTAARGLGGFVEAWSELARCLLERASRDSEAGDARSFP
jgi:hypothetical protein